MKHLFLSLFFVVSTCFTMAAQLATNENNLPDLAAILLLQEEQSKQPTVFYSPIEPISKGLSQQLHRKGLMPLYVDKIQGLLTCSWADGLGGAIECPPTAVTCGVYGNSTHLFIACVDEHNMMVGGLELKRTR